MMPSQTHELGLHTVSGPQPPQSGLQAQAQALASGWYRSPQLSAEVSHAQPHTLVLKAYPGAQVAFSTHEQAHAAVSHVSYVPHVPPQSAGHLKAHTAGSVSHTCPGAPAPPQSAGHSHRFVPRLQNSRSWQKSSSAGAW